MNKEITKDSLELAFYFFSALAEKLLNLSSPPSPSIRGGTAPVWVEWPSKGGIALEAVPP